MNKPFSLSWRDYCDNILQYQNDQLDWRDQAVNAGLGFSAEAGEVADVVKKHFFYKCSPYDLDEFRERVIEEMGDALWYMALMCQVLATDIQEIMSYNMEKLEKRNSGGT